MNKAILFLTSMVFMAQPVGAGVIYMKNGDKITGEIKKIWDGDVFIEPSYADEFSVDQVDIAYMEADPERQFDFELADGTELVGSLAGTDDDGNQLLMVDGKTQVIPLAQLAELDEPEKAFDWSAKVDINSTFNSGNTNNSNVTMTADFLYKKNKHTNIVDLLWQNENQDLDGSTVKVKDRERFRYNYNYSVSDPWFLGSSATWERDPVKGLDYRYNVVPAVGYDFWNDAGRTLALQGGAGYQAEETTDELGITTSGDGAVAALLFRFKYDFGSPDIQVWLNNTTTGAFYGRDNVVTQFNIGSKYEITDLLYLNVEFLLDYESEPVEGAKNQDASLIFGFGLEFED
jgi:putative salt-induced outer membrane protein YdiY